MPNPGSLQSALAGAKPYAQARYVSDSNAVLALVTVMANEGYWVRIFAECNQIGNQMRDNAQGVAALLAEAGIPLERGWEPWELKKEEAKGNSK